MVFIVSRQCHEGAETLAFMWAALTEAEPGKAAGGRRCWLCPFHRSEVGMFGQMLLDSTTLQQPKKAQELPSS